MADFFTRIVDSFMASPITAVFDVLFLGVLLYLAFAFLKQNNATRLVKFIVIALLLSTIFASSLFYGTIFYSISNYTLVILMVGVLLLFPAEIRRVLWRLSNPKEMSESFSTDYDETEEELKLAIDNIVKSVQNMAKKNTGALIVVAPQNIPAHILESGTIIDGKLSSALVETVFNNKTPLHDGAMIVRGGRIMATGCFLPLSKNANIDKELGTRHRAGIGVTEEHNVFTIIVSEEDGIISTALNGELNRYYDSEKLTDILLQVYGLRASGMKKKKKVKNG